MIRTEKKTEKKIDEFTFLIALNGLARRWQTPRMRTVQQDIDGSEHHQGFGSGTGREEKVRKRVLGGNSKNGKNGKCSRYEDRGGKKIVIVDFGYAVEKKKSETPPEETILSSQE